MPRPTRTPDVMQMVFPIGQAVEFDPAAFDDLIKNNGIQMTHWRALRCPAGLADINDVRRVHEHHQDCSNGFRYLRSGTVTVSFLNNSVDSRFNDVGRQDGSTVNVTLPRFYDDQPDKPVRLVQFDRMFLSDEQLGHKPLTVANWQLVQAHVTGVDRLQFPPVSVSDLIDSTGRQWTEGEDFDVTQGYIKWRNGSGPGVDPATGKGVVYSVRYEYRPFFYVANMVHEIRIAQIQDPDTGDITANRMPQSCVLKREHCFLNEENDPDAPNLSGRQQPGPARGQFGSR